MKWIKDIKDIEDMPNRQLRFAVAGVFKPTLKGAIAVSGRCVGDPMKINDTFSFIARELITRTDNCIYTSGYADSQPVNLAVKEIEYYRSKHDFIVRPYTGALTLIGEGVELLKALHGRDLLAERQILLNTLQVPAFDTLDYSAG
jgi:hypothetical protein